MRRFTASEIKKFRKSRFNCWLETRSESDIYLLKILAIHDLMGKNGENLIKESELNERMFELYEDYLQSKCPALLYHLDKKHAKIFKKRS